MPIVVAARPDEPDVAALIDRHLAFAAEHSPPRDRHALDGSGLGRPCDLAARAPRGRAAAGFVPCPPFGGYSDSPNGVHLTLGLA